LIRGGSRLVLRLVLGLLVGVGLLSETSPVHADELQTVFLDRQEALSTTQRLRAEVLGTKAGNRHGGYGYVRVRLMNPDERAHQFRLVLTPAWGPGLSRAVQSTARSVRLEGGESATLFLPLVNSDGGSQLQISVDGTPAPEGAQISGANRYGTGQLSVLAVWEDEARRAAQWTALLEGFVTPSRRGNSPLDFKARTPAQLPDRWVLLSGFDLILVDPRARGLDPETARVLVQYVAGGGTLALLEAPVDGPLAEMVAGADLPAEGASGYHGLGRFILATAGTAAPALQTWLRGGARREAYSVVGAADRKFSGAMPTPLWLPLEIPGLGEVPVTAFFFLIFAFAIVVGPVNYLYFRRKRKLAMLLVTIPALGFLCTVVILLYGLFSEGFGVIGSTRTLSVLDQREHSAATCTAQTLYAGLQPAQLEPAADAFFCSSSFELEGDGDANGLFRVDLDRGYVVEGGALPSRTPTPFLSVSVGRAREHLRFRRRADGGFDVLAGPGLEPREEANGLLLRTFDGAWYLMDARGILQPRQVQRALEGDLESAVTAPFRSLPVAAGQIQSRRGYYGGRYLRYYSQSSMAELTEGAESLAQWMQMRVPHLRPGSYLARVKRPPAEERLGLEIEYRAEEHVVLGLLAEEDLLDE
jgi:hypothetical protein